jgi:hypothetical protein
MPSVLGAQMRPQGPGPDTKRAVVTTFRGDPAAGVKLADEIRSRIQSDFNIRQLMPVSKKDIDNTLVASGYRPGLGPERERHQGAGEARPRRRGHRRHRDAHGRGLPRQRAALPARDVALSQPLISVESSNLGDVAKQIVREYENARKQIPSVTECDAALRGQKVDVASAAARKGAAGYPRANHRAALPRQCVPVVEDGCRLGHQAVEGFRPQP